MKRLILLTLALGLTASVATAQWVWAPMDNAGSDTTYFYQDGFFTNGPTAYANLSDTTESYDGNGALKVDYRIEAFDGWGGYVVRVHERQYDDFANPRYDLSAGKYLSFWYKITKQPVKDAAGDVNFEFKLKERANADAGDDLFLHNFTTIMDGPPGEWTQATVPLEVGAGAFSLQFGNEDGELQLWNITGLEMAIVYITGGNQDNPPAAVGEFLIDKVQILGQRYEPIITFDNQSDTTSNRTRKDAFWGLNDMSWDGDAGNRYFNLSDEDADTVQGAGALRVEYGVVGSQDWGGYVEFDHIFETPVDLTDNSAIAFYMKNVSASTLPDSNRTFMRLEFFDKDGDLWTAIPNVNLGETFEWSYVVNSLEETSVPWYEMLPGDEGISRREQHGNGTLDKDAITKLRFAIIVLGPREGETKGPDVVAEGEFLLDLMTPSGFSENDFTAPAVPQGLFVLGGVSAGINLVSWSDVPDEDRERYTIYYSDASFTSVEDEGVYQLGIVDENVQSFEHLFFSPLQESNVTFYYGVTATDRAGNMSEPAVSAATSNPGRKTAIFSLDPPVDFAADGDLSDWANIQPWVIKSSDATGTPIINNDFEHDGDADLWVKAWGAITETDIYVAMKVYDDFYFVDSNFTQYLQDAPDFCFGLYEYTGKDHQNYTRGARPDYHIRFLVNRAEFDHDGNARLGHHWEDNYHWEQTDSGYVLEWTYNLDSLAAVLGDSVFTPVEGMQIPMDWLINDADADLTREGIMRWSNVAIDNAYNNVRSWAYSWIGRESSTFTSVEGDNGVIGQYALHQNYPNPFNPTTTINYTMKTTGKVTIKVYNILGSEVATLVNGVQNAGVNTVNFTATDLATGIYFVRMNAGNFTSVKKIMLVK